MDTGSLINMMLDFAVAERQPIKFKIGDNVTVVKIVGNKPDFTGATGTVVSEEAWPYVTIDEWKFQYGEEFHADGQPERTTTFRPEELELTK